MAGNRAVAYLEPGRVAVQDTPYPRLEIVDGPGVNRANVGRKVEHGVILKVVSTNICGSDQHMVRGRTTAPAGLALGHEITGEVIEAGRDVEFIKVGDLCSVPFNIACGRCRKCKERKTCICLNVNPDRPGSAYGYIAGAGPVGLAAAVSAQLLGAAVVIVADLNEERLAQARSFGCEVVDVSEGAPQDQIYQLLGVPEVDCAVDAVGFEARGHGAGAGGEAPATVLNSLMEITTPGGAIGVPGHYVTADPGGVDESARVGALSLSLGTGWAKSLSFTTGQCPVMKYHRSLMMAILHERVQIAKAVNATVISLEEAPRGYADFDSGVAKKFVIDPHGMILA
jgi:glutathione-independent formaldehyde dehydrogenase